MTRTSLLGLLILVGAAGLCHQARVAAQAHAPPPRRPPAELLRLSLAAETPGLSVPFMEITTTGQVESGLFDLRSTGVSTAPVRGAAETFLAGLTAPQRARTLFADDDLEWRTWMNQRFYVRQGVSLLELTPAQRELAFALLSASLSARSLKQTRDILRLNETLGELTGNNFDEYGQWQYHVTVMGQPSATEPWGWQLDNTFLRRVRARRRNVGQVQGHDHPPGRAAARAGADQRTAGGAAQQGHPQRRQDP